MARQPISTRHPNTGLSLGPGFLESRPQAALIIAECITVWTDVEIQIARLLAAMLHANSEPAIALYLSLANERAKRDALAAIADYVFSEADRTLFDSIMKAKDSLAKERNDLAHGLFGILSDEPNGVAWISTKDRIKHMILVDAAKIKPNPIDHELLSSIKNYILVYSIDDLKTILADIYSLHGIMHKFVGYIAIMPNSTLYQQLLIEPLVQKFLSQKDASPKNDP